MLRLFINFSEDTAKISLLTGSTSQVETTLDTGMTQIKQEYS